MLYHEGPFQPRGGTPTEQNQSKIIKASPKERDTRKMHATKKSMQKVKFTYKNKDT